MSMKMAKSVSLSRPFGLYRSSPPNRAVGPCNLADSCAPDKHPGAPDKCPVHRCHPRVPHLNVSRSIVNGREPFSYRYTAPDTPPGTAPGTGQMSGASPSRAPSSTESRLPPDRRAPDKRSVRCSVRCVQLSAKPPRVSHRT